LAEVVLILSPPGPLRDLASAIYQITEINYTKH
jgi:hypothetical protein